MKLQSKAKNILSILCFPVFGDFQHGAPLFLIYHEKSERNVN